MKNIRFSEKKKIKDLAKIKIKDLDKKEKN